VLNGVSLVSTTPLTGVFTSVSLKSFTALGGVALIVIITVAVSQAEGIPLSQIAYSNVSVPINPVFGV
jgi:hypothetical protein